MKKQIILILGLFIAGFAVTASPTDFKKELAYDQINAIRVDADVTNVVSDLSLERSAEAWSRQMSELNQLQHDQNYSTGNFLAECIAFIPEDYAENKIIDVFYQSAAHRKIMLNSKWTAVGISKTKASGGYYVCLRFK